MVTWPVLPGVGIGAQAWPNLACGSLGSSSTKPFKLYLNWGNTQMIWKSINLFLYWGKNIRQELWEIVPHQGSHHLYELTKTSYWHSTASTTSILLLLLATITGRMLPTRKTHVGAAPCPQYKPGDKVVYCARVHYFWHTISTTCIEYTAVYY